MKNLLYLLITFFIMSCGGQKGEEQKTKPQVRTVKSKIQNVIIEKDFVGQVYGKEDIPITARVPGFLEGVHFEEGRPVKKGQLLYTIDQQPFKASVAAAESQLAEAKTLLVLAQNELNRIEPLAQKNAVSKSDLDAALAERDARQASVKAAESRLALERINLSYTQVKSPVNGLIGKSEAELGEYVGSFPNAVQLNTVSNVESVIVEFFITEQDYLASARESQRRIEANEELLREEIENPPKLVLADGTIYEETGSFSFINRQVDAATGSILVQTAFPNPDGLLRPGQFSRVRVAVSKLENAVMIPQRCLIELQGLFFIYLVNAEGVVEQRRIEKGPDYGDYVIVRSGLEANEEVIIEGTQFVRNGVPVDAEPVDFESQVKTIR